MMNRLFTIVSDTPLPINGSGWGWVFLLFLMGSIPLHAQEFGVEYQSELQTDFKDCNFVNLLRLDAEVPLSKSLSFQAASINIAKTREERLVEDLQTFSNIEEDNLPFALAVCGMRWEINEHHSVFLGVRNMNEDYFVSDLTSLFSNSSCGIYPTISANFPIANYPVASMGLHYKYEKSLDMEDEGVQPSLTIQGTLYNGIGYNRLVGRENVFRVCPEGDGLFGITQVEYQRNGVNCFLGACVHYGKTADDDGKRKFGTALWAYGEKHLSSHFSLLAGYSHAFASANCSDFAGIGGSCSYRRYEFGVFTDYALFKENAEWATELTCKANLSQHLYLQPAVHLVKTGGHMASGALLRMGIAL